MIDYPRLLLSAQVNARESAVGNGIKLRRIAKCLQLALDVITAPDATCELLPDLADRLISIRAELLDYAEYADGEAMVADTQAEVIETLMLADPRRK